jgi:hypothetical protein
MTQIPPPARQNHRDTETQRRDGKHWRRRRGDHLGCQMVDASGRQMTAPRAGVPGMTDLRGAVLDNVGTTVTQTGRSVGAQYCQGGHPRGARRGEGASKVRGRCEMGAACGGYRITLTIGTVDRVFCDDDYDDDDDEERETVPGGWGITSRTTRGGRRR